MHSIYVTIFFSFTEENSDFQTAYNMTSQHSVLAERRTSTTCSRVTPTQTPFLPFSSTKFMKKTMMN